MTSGTDHKFSPSPLVFTLLCIGAVLPALLLAYAIGLTWPGTCRLAMLGDGWQWWSGSYLARYGQIGTLFHPELMAAWHGPTGCAGHTWSYPPSMLVLVLPLAALSPLASIALFDGLGILGFAWAIRLAGIKGRLWFAMMFSPVVIYNLVANQNGAWFGTFLVAGLALSETSPVFGGILLGLLSVKPQLCVLLPAYLLGRRNWRCIAGAGLTALALVVVSIFLFSWQSWVLFVSAVIPAQQAVLSVATMQHGSFMFITIYALAHWAGLSAGWSNIIQLGCSVLVMLVVFFMARQERIEVAVKWALLAILGVLATPYMQRYDMFGVTFACGLLFQRCAADKPDFVIRGALALLWVIPGLMPWLALLQLPPLVPLLAVLVVGAWLMGEMRKQDPAPGALKVV